MLTTARDRVSTYQWGSYQIEHHHCAICGCGTWSHSPLWDQNAWLLEDFDPDAQPVAVIDGQRLW